MGLEIVIGPVENLPNPVETGFAIGDARWLMGIMERKSFGRNFLPGSGCFYHDVVQHFTDHHHTVCGIGHVPINLAAFQDFNDKANTGCEAILVDLVCREATRIKQLGACGSIYLFRFAFCAEDARSRFLLNACPLQGAAPSPPSAHPGLLAARTFRGLCRCHRSRGDERHYHI